MARKFVSVVLITIISSLSAIAKDYWDISAGYSYRINSESFLQEVTPPSMKSKVQKPHGAYINVEYSHFFGEKFGISTGAKYSYYGFADCYVVNETSLKRAVHSSFLDVPFLMRFYLEGDKRYRILFDIGPLFSFFATSNIYIRQRVFDEETNARTGPYSKNFAFWRLLDIYEIKDRLDSGVHADLKIEVSKLVMDFGYSYYFINKAHAFWIGVGYKF